MVTTSVVGLLGIGVVAGAVAAGWPRQQLRRSRIRWVLLLNCIGVVAAIASVALGALLVFGIREHQLIEATGAATLCAGAVVQFLQIAEDMTERWAERFSLVGWGLVLVGSGVALFAILLKPAPTATCTVSSPQVVCAVTFGD
ncbi:hypothetical protein [Modestobacter sp. VKM Ac-2985]|uniref:hypothetical protein n=1 Tax=Modestobacter sp. VKM Ac-2985 TaxID=3004139 RepID=UPI0022AB9A00|nr:hypothetical protein [Modestobacter sp. VKM Ac-2985]MCZ2837619.1 hypothetical protein [Modestobacter sp. VKM Ac-2985]